jgi:hypothetical protein
MPPREFGSTPIWHFKIHMKHIKIHVTGMNHPIIGNNEHFNSCMITPPEEIGHSGLIIQSGTLQINQEVVDDEIDSSMTPPEAIDRSDLTMQMGSLQVNQGK